MNNISFNDGFKEYTINNDPNKVIRFDPSDIGIISRISIAYENIQKIADEMSQSNVSLNLDGTANETARDIQSAGDFVKEIDCKIRNEIDFVLNTKACDVAFGETSCLAMVGGTPLYERFLDAVMPIIKSDVEKEKKASAERIKKYTQSAKKAGKK